VPRRHRGRMRQVDACDFCGDAPDGVFEVVPAAVPDGPVRLALCAGCQSTLETVVDPLLAAGRDAAADDDDDDDGHTRDGTDDNDDGDDDGAAEPGESTAGTADSSAASAEPGDEAAAAAAGASDDDDDAAADDGDDADGDADADTGGGRTGGETREDDAGAGEDDDDDGDGITIEQQSGDTPAGRRPDGYAQVLRLLENRAGGMPRSDLRSLATNAYGLTDAAFEAAVEAAIENGDVTEASDGLRRT